MLTCSAELSIEILSPSFQFVQGYDAPHPVSLNLLKYPTRPTHSWLTHGELFFFCQVIINDDNIKDNVQKCL